MNQSLMFSSATDMWSTPHDFFETVNKVFHFDIDVCASADNAKCSRFYTQEDDGLAQQWFGTCWMNPPYGRGIAAWVSKAYWSAKQNGATVVCLLPARTDTRWWHDFCAKGEVVFLKGRLKFGGAKNGAPFPSALCVFRPGVSDIMELLNK